jgi:hypothetical protein
MVLTQIAPKVFGSRPAGQPVHCDAVVAAQGDHALILIVSESASIQRQISLNSSRWHSQA